jgi:hypothetical protein
MHPFVTATGDNSSGGLVVRPVAWLSSTSRPTAPSSAGRVGEATAEQRASCQLGARGRLKALFRLVPVHQLDEARAVPSRRAH